MIYSQVFAWRGKQALLILADPFRELFLTRWLSEICCGTTHIVNITLELRIICHSGSFFDQGLMTSGLKNSSLMKSQGAEITAAKAPSVACQAELDFFQCRNSAQLLIHGMNFLRIRQGIYIIHFLLRQGQSRRILYNISLCPIRFCHWSGAEWICILILNGKAVCINLLIYFYFLIRRKNNRIINSRQIPALKYSSCNIGKFLYRQSTRQRICNLYDRMLSHSIGNHICPGIKEYTVFYFILPIIIMCRDWSSALFGYGIMVYHGIHISRRHQKSQSRLSKYLNTLLLSPVRLRNDPHFIPTTLQQSADDRSTKGRMVHVGITCNIGKIYLLPPSLFHFFLCYR